MGAKSTVRVVCAMCFSIAFVRIVIHSKATCAFSLTITIRWRWRKTIELKQNRMKTAPWAPKQTHNEKSRVQYSILANRSSLIFNMHSTIYMSVCVCVCVGWALVIRVLVIRVLASFRYRLKAQYSAHFPLFAFVLLHCLFECSSCCPIRCGMVAVWSKRQFECVNQCTTLVDGRTTRWKRQLQIIEIHRIWRRVLLQPIIGRYVDGKGTCLGRTNSN